MANTIESAALFWTCSGSSSRAPSRGRWWGVCVVRSDLCTLGGSASAAAVMSFSITRFAALYESKRGVGQ